jgi:hypothetical protein
MSLNFRPVALGFLHPTLCDAVFFEHVSGDGLHAVGHRGRVFEVVRCFENCGAQDVEEASLVGRSFACAFACVLDGRDRRRLDDHA